MASVLGELVVKVTGDVQKFNDDINTAEKRFNSFSEKAKKVGSNLTTFVTLPILGIGTALVKTAIDAEETNSKFNTVFKNVRKQADDVAKNLSKNFGLSSTKAKQLLGDTGDLLTGFGFTGKAALDLSEEVNELAVDLASFTNFAGGAEGASVALTKALLGETEQSKALGIVIRQDSEEFINLVETFQKAEGATLLQAKALAALEIATNQSKNAIGDFERTQDSAANQIRILQGDVQTLMTDLGEGLLPIAKDVIQFARDLVQGFLDLSDSSKGLIIGALGVAAAIGPLTAALGFLAANPVVAVIAGITAIAGIITIAVNEANNLERATNDLIKISEEYEEVSSELETVTDEYNSITKTLTESQDELTEAEIEQLKNRRDLLEVEKEQLENRKLFLKADFLSQIGKVNDLIKRNSKRTKDLNKDLGDLETAYDRVVATALETAPSLEKAERSLQRTALNLKKQMNSARSEMKRLGDESDKAFDALARGIASGIIESGDLLTVSKANREEILKRVDAIKKLEKAQSDTSDSATEGNNKENESGKTLSEDEIERLKRLNEARQEISLRRLDSIEQEKQRAILAAEEEKQAFIDAGVEKFLAEEEFQRRVTEIEKEFADERVKTKEQEEAKKRAAIGASLSAIKSSFDQFLSARIAQIKAEGDAQGNLTQSQKDEIKALLIAQKASAVTQSVIDGILAVQKTIASVPFPFNIPLGIAQGAVAAANTFQIISQPIPQFQEGGFVPATRGGQLATVAEGGVGEFIVPDRSDVFNALADRIASNAGGGTLGGVEGGPIFIRLDIDGNAIDARVTESSRDGRIIITQDSIAPAG